MERTEVADKACKEAINLLPQEMRTFPSDIHSYISNNKVNEIQDYPIGYAMA